MQGFASKETVERLRKEYPEGTRVMLLGMDDPYSKLVPGDRGNVMAIDDAGTVHVRWDSGSGLGLVYGEDSFRKLTPKELEEEKNTTEKPSVRQKLAENKASIDKPTQKSKNKEIEL